MIDKIRPDLTHVSEDGTLTPMISLRDWFAGQALVGLLSGRPDADCGVTGYCADAYRYADAMLAVSARS